MAVPDGAEAFFGQLSSPARVFDVRPGPVPCVLFLSRSCDSELDAVRDLLGRAGVRSARLNADELAATTGLTVDPATRTACVNERRLAPTVTWTRHFSANAIEGGDDAAHRVFARESWQAAADELAAISGTSLGARRPALLAQLRLARHHDVAVPRTIVTTDPGRARDAFACPRLVIKAVHRHFVEAAPGRLSGIFPTVVERRSLPADPCPGPPVIVQEYVEHETEWRVYYVGGQVHGFELPGGHSPADLWTAGGRVEVRSGEPPPAVAAAATLLASAMSLRYGAFDFLVREGTPVFLEVNPDGDWRWAERRTRTTLVTNAVAALLAGLHREALPGTGLSGPPGTR
ncbi:hypothetical protein Airi01_038810 [Actinoallomurus iriomotensis]|uniref:ATP-grasp domain-containing protein n=1 Tax=Actinoallomurus iriomotensis TaxID=478107 RepID=A0A9W6RHF0_9ACTN|nr:hypothetical protein Airi01_038810 [Actinoallomurus iriomotensis]